MHTANPSVFAVVLNWNQAAMTLDCIRSLLAQTVPVRIIVVDNGSTESNRIFLKASLPAACHYIQNPRNLGFAEGMNVGIHAGRLQGAEFIWLMNNDAFPTTDCLRLLIQKMQNDNKLGAVVPKQVDKSGFEPFTGGEIDWSSGAITTLSAHNLQCPSYIGTWLSGFAIFVRVDAIDKIGYFDDRFFAYWEDVDLCVRLHKAGWSLAAVPNAYCVHLGSSTSIEAGSKFSEFMMTRNGWLFLRKHALRSDLPNLFVNYMTSHWMRAKHLFEQGRIDQSRAIIAALVAIIFGKYGPPKSFQPIPMFEQLIMSCPWRVCLWLRGIVSTRMLRQQRSRTRLCFSSRHTFLS